MRWPWVSRELLDDLSEKWLSERQELAAGLESYARTLKDANEHHEREMVRAEARWADLMASYRLLRLQGFVPGEPPTVTKPVPPDPVTSAINRASRGDPELRRRMLAQVELDRTEKPDITDVELVMRIERGNRPAEELT